MKKAIQRLKNERGLTLVELLAVIVILAIIAIIAFVFIGGIIDNSKKDAHVSNAQQIIAAAKLYEATGGDLPVSVGHLVSEKYLEPILDPWDKDPYIKEDTTIRVGKDGTNYRLLDAFAGDKCTIPANTTEQDMLKKGRGVCN